MTGRDLRESMVKAGMVPKQFAPWLGISVPTLSRLIHSHGQIPKRYWVALRYLHSHGDSEPILSAHDVLAMWRGPRWRLACAIGMTDQHLGRMLAGRYAITKPVSLAIRQAVLDYQGEKEAA